MVDDSAVARRNLGRIVARLSFEIVEAADGEEALVLRLGSGAVHRAGDGVGGMR